MSEPIEGSEDVEAMASAILMLADGENSMALVVEGENEEKIFHELVNTTTCEVYDAKGKENVLSIRGHLQAGQFDGALYLIDRDHDHLLGVSIVAPDVVVTDENDFDLVLLRSKAFEKVLHEKGSKLKLKSQIPKGQDPRDRILESALALGYLRFYSRKEKLGLKFRGVRLSFVDVRTGKVDVSEMVRLIFSRTKLNDNAQQSKATSFVKSQLSRRANAWTFCCGHDVVEIFGIFLQRLFGSVPAKETQREALEERLRLAYERTYFRSTSMYKKILQWEKSNAIQCLLP
jgi:hypothetical protein